MDVRVKRIYEAADSSDGFRVLVDRLWPRGVSKERAALDLWAKAVAPSDELRHAWHADPDHWEVYAGRYRAALAGPLATELADLRERLAGHRVVTLLFASHDVEHNNAVVLAGVLA